MSVRISVQYFAILREQAGQSGEEVDTESATARAFFDECRARHGFSLDADRLKVVVNEEFVDWSHKLSDGDDVAFIPPVAGG